MKALKMSQLNELVTSVVDTPISYQGWPWNIKQIIICCLLVIYQPKDQSWFLVNCWVVSWWPQEKKYTKINCACYLQTLHLFVWPRHSRWRPKPCAYFSILIWRQLTSTSVVTGESHMASEWFLTRVLSPFILTERNYKQMKADRGLFGNKASQA